MHLLSLSRTVTSSCNIIGSNTEQLPSKRHTYQEHQQAEEALLEAKKDGIRRLAITRKMKERQT